MRMVCSGFRFGMAIALGIVFLACVPQAWASFTPNMFLCLNDSSQTTCASGDYVEIFSDGTNIAVITGGTTSGVSVNNGPGINRVTVSAQIGSFQIDTSTGLLKATGGQALDLSWNDTSSGAGTLWIWWGATGFTGTGASFSGMAGPNNTGSISSVSIDGCIVDTNTLGTATAPSTAGTPLPGCTTAGTEGTASAMTTASGVSALGFSTGTSSTTPFSLEEQVKVVSSGSGQTSGDFSLNNNIPEPASFALLGGVLLLTFGAIRRKLHSS